MGNSNLSLMNFGPFDFRKILTRKMKILFLTFIVNLALVSAEVTHHVHNLVYNTHIQQNLDDCGFFGDRFYFQDFRLKDGENFLMLVTSFQCWYPKTVTNILKLSPAHFVFNIRHQNRCNGYIENLKFYLV